MISAAVGAAKMPARSGSALTSSFISQRALILSQLRSLAEFWSRPSRTSSILPWVFSMTARRLSVALSCAKFSIQWIFQWRSCMSMASSRRTATSARRQLVLLVQHPLDVVEVALHLGDEAGPPPVRELEAVDGQDRAQVGTDLAGVLVVLGDDRMGREVVLLRRDVDAGLGRDGGRVQVAVDVLVDPVRRERRAEAAEHVVAGEPPAADVLVHRAERLRAVQVVVDPEQQLLGLGRPLHGERVVAEELAEDFFLQGHRCFLLRGLSRWMTRVRPPRGRST